MKKLKGIDGKLDDAWAILVKLKADNRCEYCGKAAYVKDTGRKVGMQAHHIYSRSKRSTRWLIINGISLCPAHHTLSSEFSAHKTPMEFTTWILKERGEEWFDDLTLKANTMEKLFKFEKEALLEMLLMEIKEYERTT